MITRALVAAGIIVAAGIYASGASGPERVPARDALATTPVTLARWEGRDVALDDDVIAQLGVDDYINRRYVASDAPPVALYVGYYASQRQGDTIHSPQNCLPGAGWQPVTAERTTLDVGRADHPREPVHHSKGDRSASRFLLVSRALTSSRQRARQQGLADARRSTSSPDGWGPGPRDHPGGLDDGRGIRGALDVLHGVVSVSFFPTAMRISASFVQLAAAVFLASTAAGVTGCANPEDQARNYTASGDAYAAKQQFKEAEIEYRRALAATPNAADVRYKLGRVYQDTR